MYAKYETIHESYCERHRSQKRKLPTSYERGNEKKESESKNTDGKKRKITNKFPKKDGFRDLCRKMHDFLESCNLPETSTKNKSK